MNAQPELPGLNTGGGRPGAWLSACGLYRYRLWRTWDESKQPLAWCMLNPSKADAEDDDPTIRRVVRFSRDHGYGAIEVINLFAYRATKPRELRKAANPIGSKNQIALNSVFDRDLVVAWGAIPKSSEARATEVLEFLTGWAANVFCLGTTKQGHPRHPLFVSADTRLQPFKPEPTTGSTDK